MGTFEPENIDAEGDKQRNIDRKYNVSPTVFPEEDKQRNINRKHNVSATMFPEEDKQRNIDRKHNVFVIMFLCFPHYLKDEHRTATHLVNTHTHGESIYFKYH